MADNQQLKSDQNYSYHADEISLVELWAVLVKRKVLILMIFGGCLLLTVIYLLLAKPVYESRAVVRIGQIGRIGQTGQADRPGYAGVLEKPNLLEEPTAVIQQLKEEYRVDDDSEGARKLPLLHTVSSDQKAGEDIIILTARGFSAGQARAFLTKVTGKLLQQHERLYQQAIGLRQAQLKSLKKQLQQLDAEIAQYEQKIKGSPNSALAAILTLEKMKLFDLRPVLERQISELELMISPLYSRPTQLLREPTLPVKPAQPKRSLYLALAGVLGLMLGVFAACGAEFIDKLKR